MAQKTRNLLKKKSFLKQERIITPLSENDKYVMPKAKNHGLKTPRVFHGKCFTPMEKRPSMAVVKMPKKHPNQWTIGRVTKKQIAVVDPNNPKH